jgi:hypothetical protein
MKSIYLALLVVLYLVPALSTGDPIDKVAGLIRGGNISELSKLFASNIEITILDEGNMYSKEQAGFILEKFFSQNKPRTVQMLHKINSNPSYRFGVLIVNTNKGPYRIDYTVKGTDTNFMIIEFRIEREKVK